MTIKERPREFTIVTVTEDSPRRPIFICSISSDSSRHPPYLNVTDGHQYLKRDASQVKTTGVIPISLAVVAILLPAQLSTAQTALTEHTIQLDDPANQPSAKVDDVAWLSGHWRGKGLGGTIEEFWSPPQGGTMVGTFKLMKADTVSMYELCAIVEENDRIAMWVKHFNPDFTGWEEKSDKVVFPLIRIEPGALYFEGLTFKQLDDDTIDIYLAFGGQGGEIREAKLEYTRYR